METIFAQIVADLWKVHPDDVVVSLADTASIAMASAPSPAAAR